MVSLDTQSFTQIYNLYRLKQDYQIISWIGYPSTKSLSAI